MAIAALASCGGSSPTTTPAPSTTSADVPAVTFPKILVTSPGATAPPTTLDEKAAVLAAYEEYFRVTRALFRNPVANSPDLANVATGEQKANIERVITDELTNRHVTRSPSPSVARQSAMVDNMTNDAALLTVCSVDDSYRLYLDTGRITDDETITSLFKITMTKEEKRWKVARIDRPERHVGVAGCALR